VVVTFVAEVATRSLGGSGVLSPILGIASGALVMTVVTAVERSFERTAGGEH
jgi:hypothetical protein